LLADRDQSAGGDGTGDIIALDAKMNFDDNALERHKDIESLRDVDEEDPAETEAAKWALNYVKLDGQIGCMVNGAASPWPPWTSSSSMARSPPTSRCRRRRHQGARHGGLQDHLTGPNVEGILVNILKAAVTRSLVAPPPTSRKLAGSAP